MASFQAKINRATDSHGKKIRIRMQSRWQHFGQDIQSREGYWVAHQGQLNEFLDRAAPKLGPDPLVFPPSFLCCGMRRPFNAQMSEVVETDGDRAALIDGRVQVHAQARDGR